MNRWRLAVRFSSDEKRNSVSRDSRSSVLAGGSGGSVWVDCSIKSLNTGGGKQVSDSSGNRLELTWVSVWA